MTFYDITCFDTRHDQFIEMGIKTDAEDKAIMFAKELFNQKTMNDKPINITAVWVRKWVWRKLGYVTVYWFDKDVHGGKVK